MLIVSCFTFRLLYKHIKLTIQFQEESVSPEKTLDIIVTYDTWPQKKHVLQLRHGRNRCRKWKTACTSNNQDSMWSNMCILRKSLLQLHYAFKVHTENIEDIFRSIYDFQFLSWLYMKIFFIFSNNGVFIDKQALM